MFGELEKSQYSLEVLVCKTVKNNKQHLGDVHLDFISCALNDDQLVTPVYY